MDKEVGNKVIEDYYQDVEGDEWSGFWSDKNERATNKTVKNVKEVEDGCSSNRRHAD